MKQFLFLFFILSILSCEQQGTETEDPSSAKKARAKMFAGKPDLPANEIGITSIGIGKILLADSLNSVHPAYDSVRDILLYKNYGEWPAKKIVLNKDQWILAESVNSVNQITALYTNAETFRTKKGYRIGMPLDSIDLMQDSLLIDESQKAFFLYNSGIWFKIDLNSEKRFFKAKDRDVNFIKEATISEFFIICGDC